MRGFKRDPIEMAKQVFADERSFISAWPNPGHEILYGLDWEARKRQLNDRAKGRCERMLRLGQNWTQCANDADDPHHLDNKVGRRCDCMHNLLALCRFHHEQVPEHAKRRVRWTGDELK